MAVELRNVRSLLGEKFLIPHYQRGYRWTRTEIKQLLQDILEFQRRKEKGELKKGEYYCLQPIIVKRKESYWEVVDGQQRLTTLFLILKSLETLLKEEFYIDNLYEIHYETREKSWEFLNQIFTNAGEIQVDNIDFYFIKQAKELIETWLEETVKNRLTTKRKFAEVLIDEVKEGGKDIANNVRLIWYEIENFEDPVKTFVKLNSGKIPLSNAELIKASLMRSKEREEQLKLASEWYYIERHLQDDSFWYFFNPKDKGFQSQSRIDRLFRMLAEDKKKEVEDISISKHDRYFSFHVFEELIKKENEQGKVRDRIWEEIKKLFESLNSLYSERYYFHVSGFLIHTNISNVERILKIFTSSKKSLFEEKLKELVREKIKLENIDELDYESDKREILNLLLLFNIILTHKSNFMKFPFDIYVKNKWSIEHVHARSARNLNKDEIKDLLNSYRVYLELLNEDKSEETEEKITKLREKIEKLSRKEKISEHELDSLEEELFERTIFGRDGNTIDNLALLPQDLNASLSNRTFYEKRRKIIQFDRDGKFIPLGTKYVFFKYFTENPTTLIKWTEKDREKYIEFLKKTIKEFIKDG